MTSSSVSRKSCRVAEFALTRRRNVGPRIDHQRNNTGRTEQTQKIFLRGTVLWLPSLLFDELRGDFVHICPVLSESRNRWAFVSLHHPGKETIRGKLESFHRE